MQYCVLLRVIKPFGIEELTTVEEAFRSMVVPDGELYQVEIGSQIFEIRSDQYGTTEEQRKHLAVFMPEKRKESYIKSGKAFHSNITTVTMKLAHMLTIRRGIVNWIRLINLKKSLKDLIAWANEGLQNNVAITLIEGGMESWRAKQ